MYTPHLTWICHSDSRIFLISGILTVFNASFPLNYNIIYFFHFRELKQPPKLKIETLFLDNHWTSTSIHYVDWKNEKDERTWRRFIEMWMWKQNCMLFLSHSLGCKHIHTKAHTHTHKDHLSPVSGQRMGGLGGVHCPISSSEKRILFQVVGPAEKRVCACVCVRFSLYLHLSQSC